MNNKLLPKNLAHFLHLFNTAQLMLARNCSHVHTGLEKHGLGLWKGSELKLFPSKGEKLVSGYLNKQHLVHVLPLPFESS